MRIGKIAQVMALAVGCTRQAAVEAPKPAAPVASTPESRTTVESSCWLSLCKGHTLITCRSGKYTTIDCQEHCRSWNRDRTSIDETPLWEGTCGEWNGEATCTCCDVREPECAAKLGPRQPS
ncbi:hypothetical protein SAMN02745121_09241 [Nannocystis exedens]|uniref:CVNH domain-containing protein n=1 Tax=Nannocystis exedens TaxID=54 RepID=A0A1I2J9Z1_9BACT|nr:hypothetical protein NAEX_00897 [Nannocystis exedens]SFF51119.1 hypothetical protein SAMN02745121_09241 [Nannocystis exedens]